MHGEVKRIDTACSTSQRGNNTQWTNGRIQRWEAKCGEVNTIDGAWPKPQRGNKTEWESGRIQKVEGMYLEIKSDRGNGIYST